MNQHVINLLQTQTPAPFTPLYAAWWKRAAAFVADVCLATIPPAVVFLPIFIRGWEDYWPVLERLSPASSPEEKQIFITVWALTLSAQLTWAACVWFYFAWAESRYQTTLAKRFFRLRVTNAQDASRLSFGRAAVRALIKLACAGTLYPLLLLPLFTRKKQALHDFAARSVVIQI